MMPSSLRARLGLSFPVVVQARSHTERTTFVPDLLLRTFVA
jgi:hypothetical protein